MHSTTFVLIYGTIWRSWTWGSSPTWGVWSLNVIKDKSNTHTHTYIQTHTSAQEHTQIHILTRLCNELQKNPGGHHGWVVVWWGSSVLSSEAVSKTSHMCNMISTSAKGLPLLISKHGPCVGPLLHASCCGNLSQNAKFVYDGSHL